MAKVENHHGISGVGSMGVVLLHGCSGKAPVAGRLGAWAAVVTYISKK